MEHLTSSQHYPCEGEYMQDLNLCLKKFTFTNNLTCVVTVVQIHISSYSGVTVCSNCYFHQQHCWGQLLHVPCNIKQFFPKLVVNAFFLYFLHPALVKALCPSSITCNFCFQKYFSFLRETNQFCITSPLENQNFTPITPCFCSKIQLYSCTKE